MCKTFSAQPTETRITLTHWQTISQDTETQTRKITQMKVGIQGRPLKDEMLRGSMYRLGSIQLRSLRNG